MSPAQPANEPEDVDKQKPRVVKAVPKTPLKGKSLSEWLRNAPDGCNEFDVVNPEDVEEAMGIGRTAPTASTKDASDQPNSHWLDDLEEERRRISRAAGQYSDVEQQRILKEYRAWLLANHPRGKTVLRVAILTNVLHVLASTILSLFALLTVTVLWLIGVVSPISILITFAVICTVGVLANVTGVWAAKLTEWDEMVRVEAGRLRTNATMLLAASIAIYLLI